MRILLLFLVVALAHAQYNETIGKILGQLTVASYCKPSLIESWTCNPCKDYPKMKFVKVIKNSTNDTLGFIGVSDELDATSKFFYYLVLVFRGTLPWDVKNWISDINFLKKKYPFCDDNCEVHRGFYEDYEDIQDSVRLAVANYSTTYKKKFFYVTGHSLGAALSTFAVAHMIHLGVKVDLFYNLGSPRVGDARFHDWFTRKFGHFLARITHHKDPVPHLPL